MYKTTASQKGTTKSSHMLMCAPICGGLRLTMNPYLWLAEEQAQTFITVPQLQIKTTRNRYK